MAIAENMKKKGKTLNELIARKSIQLYGEEANLNTVKREKIRFMQRLLNLLASQTQNAIMSKLSKAGRGLIVISMQLSVTEDFTSKLIRNSSDLPPQSELLQNEMSTGIIIRGAILESVIQCGEYFLIFMTDDVPYEDTLSIFLLDTQLNILDSATIGGMYLTGSLSNIKLIPPNHINFNYIGGCDCLIDILPAPKFHIPSLSPFNVVKRPFRFYRYFILSCECV